MYNPPKPPFDFTGTQWDFGTEFKAIGNGIGAFITRTRAWGGVWVGAGNS